jgi:hypothetical protein
MGRCVKQMKSGNPRGLAQHLVQTEIEANPEFVGWPITIVSITAAGARMGPTRAGLEEVARAVNGPVHLPNHQVDKAKALVIEFSLLEGAYQVHRVA